jgi:predicted double-glycine peptidase
MNPLLPWAETALTLLAAGVACWLGLQCARSTGKRWLWGVLAPLAFLLLYCTALFEPRLADVPPLSMMSAGRARYVVFNVIVVVMLSTLMGRLQQRRLRILLAVLIVSLTAMSAVPFAAPGFNRSYLAGLKTRIDSDGVCRQSNGYTCGPAAAVTALRKLGLPADEGELAILAHTRSLTGTELDTLAGVLKRRYGKDGLQVNYRGFTDLEDLKKAGLTVVVIKFNALQDHCVTVMGVESNMVAVADPLNGLSYWPAETFEDKWLYAGIVLHRDGSHDSPPPTTNPPRDQTNSIP